MLQAKCEYGFPANDGEQPEVLGEIDYVFVPGIITGVTGVDGTGKTTLLKTLAGIIPSLSGTVTFQGKDVQDPDIQAKFQYVGRAELDPNLTVEEHFAKIAHTRKASFKEVEDSITTWQLSGFLDTMPDDLTIERTQRVNLALAMLHPLRVLFIDQPIHDLEEAWNEIVAGELQRLADDGVTIVVASQDDVVLASANTVLDLGAVGETAHLGM